jgi:hypothetical protein
MIAAAMQIGPANESRRNPEMFILTLPRQRLHEGCPQSRRLAKADAHHRCRNLLTDFVIFHGLGLPADGRGRHGENFIAATDDSGFASPIWPSFLLEQAAMPAPISTGR